MKKISFLICIAACLIACSGGRAKQEGELPIIDIIGNMSNFQRIYMSELFSSIELISLETREDCLVDVGTTLNPVLNDSIIIMPGGNLRKVLAFDRSSGKFRNQIGSRGQGPHEFASFPWSIFFNTDKPTVFALDISGRKILEYDFAGRYVRSFSLPEVDGRPLTELSHIGDSLFIGSMPYTGDNAYKYFLFDHNGDIVQGFPNYIFFNMQRFSAGMNVAAMEPARVDTRLYLMDRLNDTIYVFENSNLQPAYVFDFGRTFPREFLEAPFSYEPRHFPNLIPGFIFVATPRYFFYDVRVPRNRPQEAQRISPFWNPYFGEYQSLAFRFFGIYDIAQNRNILLDTDQHLQQGIVNDINGGLSFIPRFYAGNGEVVGVWNPEDMLEILDIFPK